MDSLYCSPTQRLASSIMQQSEAAAQSNKEKMADHVPEPNVLQDLILQHNGLNDLISKDFGDPPPPTQLNNILPAKPQNSLTENGGQRNNQNNDCDKKSKLNRPKAPPPPPPPTSLMFNDNVTKNDSSFEDNLPCSSNPLIDTNGHLSDQIGGRSQEIKHQYEYEQPSLCHEIPQQNGQDNMQSGAMLQTRLPIYQSGEKTIKPFL